MDTITHGVVGSLIAGAISERPLRNKIRFAVIGGSVMPDLDLLAGLFTSDEFFELEFHRGITHSLVALPIFAGLLALITWRKRENWKLLALAYAVGLGSHVFLDVITAYGTMIFQPVSMERYTFDTVFIIDLTLSSIALIPQLVAYAWAEPGKGPRRAWILWLMTACGAIVAYVLVNAAGVLLKFSAIAAAILIFGAAFAIPGYTSIGRTWPRGRYCRIGFALFALYIGACAFAHQRALQQVRGLAAKYQIEAEQIAALPAPPSLLHWSGLVQTPEGFARFPITLGDDAEPSVERFVNSPQTPYHNKMKYLPQLQTYLWFARFPWMIAREEGAETIVEYRDLQFLRPNRRNESPFTFRARFDLHGNLLAAELVRR